MNKTSLLILWLALIGGTSCRHPHFITDTAYRKEVEADFRTKQERLDRGDLFRVFDRKLTTEEREALMFLYAYMPAGDAADYDGAFYLENVRAALRARREMPWGDSVPETVFRHFVLPLRVNNENLDSCRTVFYEALKDRVKGLSLYDAVLEVNHWCHEKVVYTPSDGRTSSPLASVRSASGRCGEESTFTVAALRAVGIPARQVYTPRWAHTDDNHAWVEAWVGGRWYFLGACEPEPVLNLGWFNDPASRSMLMHTKVFGRYPGPEEIMQPTACYTEINVTSNYAPTARASVKITDEDGAPVAGASVEFKLYNYAEFCTVARKQTDAGGRTSLNAGKGDLLVWASKDGRFGYGKLSVGKDAEITIALNRKPGASYSFPIDIVPPPPGSISVQVTEAQKAANAVRLQREDSLRTAYTATFLTPERAGDVAEELATDPVPTVKYLTGSRGNWREIERFLRETPAGKRADAIALLGAVSSKDLRDAPASVLADHLARSVRDRLQGADSAFYVDYVLNPRIGNEWLTPYKSVFLREVDPELQRQVQADPLVLAGWCNRELRPADDLNPQQIPMMPTGVWKSRVADAASRDVFFVAMCRSFGIPARVDKVTGKVQYARDGKWFDVDFTGKTEGNPRTGAVLADLVSTATPADPQYYSHFTLAKITDGVARTLEFEGVDGSETGAGSWSTLLKEPLTLDEGYYMLVTGTRMASGAVLADVTFFQIEAPKLTIVNLTMRDDGEGVQVIGNLDSEALFLPVGADRPQSILSATGRGYFVVAVVAARQEPTNHVLRDLARLGREYEAWGRKLVVLFPDRKQWKNFDEKEFPGLPSNILFGIDTGGSVARMLGASMHLSGEPVLPLFVIGDTFNRVVFASQGYSIGLGDRMLEVIRKL